MLRKSSWNGIHSVGNPTYSPSLKLVELDLAPPDLKTGPVRWQPPASKFLLNKEHMSKKLQIRRLI